MFGLIEGIISFVFGMVEMALGLAWGAVELVFGLLGGLLSLLLSLGGVVLVGALILLAVFRRRDHQKQGHPYAENNSQPEPEKSDDEEEFTSFYDQFRTQE